MSAASSAPSRQASQTVVVTGSADGLRSRRAAALASAAWRRPRCRFYMLALVPIPAGHLDGFESQPRPGARRDLRPYDVRMESVFNWPMAVLLVIVAWVAVGALTGLVEARQGHWSKSWVLGVVLGPFAVPLAVHTHRREARATRTLSVGDARCRHVDVFVGVDGSAASMAAATKAAALVRDAAGPVDPGRRARSRHRCTARRFGLPAGTVGRGDSPPRRPSRRHAGWSGRWRPSSRHRSCSPGARPTCWRPTPWTTASMSSS